MSFFLRLLVALPLLLGCRASATAPDWGAIESELETRAAEDQAVRNQLTGDTFDHALFARLAEVDRANTAWLRALIERHGWPGRTRVGTEGARDAWLLVQHADHDVDFQEHCLALLAAAVAAGEADPKELAYLEDRVAMHRGRPQRYGTQFVQAPDGQPGFVPHTLAEPARVDELRASVGLGPLEEYARRINGG
jgi:hypothetical protein